MCNNNVKKQNIKYKNKNHPRTMNKKKVWKKNFFVYKIYAVDTCAKHIAIISKNQVPNKNVKSRNRGI